MSKPIEKPNKYWFSKDGLTGFGTLPTGEVFLFDAEDYEKTKHHQWYVKRVGDRYYVQTANRILLHRLIMNAPKWCEVDHISLNPLDNRKKNMRICTHRQNQCNHPIQSNNTSGVSGVHWQKNRHTWNARIKYFGKEIHLGAYQTFVEAVQARNEGMKWLFGEYGRYEDVPDTPLWIKNKVSTICGRFVDNATIYPPTPMP